MRLRVAGELDLRSSLHSGQAFRWQPADADWQVGLIGNRPVRLRPVLGGLEWEGPVDEADLRRYLRLDGTHERFLGEVVRDAPLERALGHHPGLRVLGQDPWEVLCAYILSANSNVAKISRTIEGVARLGAPEAEGRAPFPGAEALASLSEADLRSTGMGYRAPYLRAAARLVADGDLDPHGLARLPYEEARAALLEVPGVGPKVADCVLLYGCDHFGAFPVDVWIDRVLREEYFPRKRMNHAQWGTWARGHFGPWAGYAQHYLFHDRRSAGWERKKPGRRIEAPA